jgi:CHAD domain-containing protein
MFVILHELGMFVVAMFKSRRRLEAENLFLRHQLNIALRRAPPRRRLHGSDRALLVWITRIWPNLLDLSQVVKPETILRWHRSGFKAFWPAAEQFSRRFEKIRRRGRKIADLNSEKLHNFRIQVKKARYAAEFFSSMYSDKKSAKRCKKVCSALRQLQNSLGRINDIATHTALLTHTINNPRRRLIEKQNHQRAFAAGLIIGDHMRVFRG